MAFTVTKFDEWCPNCESENEFRSDGHKVYICQHCGYALAPCSLCEMDKARCSECEIIEARGDLSNTLTFITSNIPINHKLLIEQYNDRVASRLSEMCNYYEIRGIDRRKL